MAVQLPTGNPYASAGLPAGNPYAAPEQQQALPQGNPYAQPDPNAKGPKYDPQAVATLWRKHGGDPKVADLMGEVAYNESTGNPTASNEYTDDKGKVHKVAGLFQISDVHGPGNYQDPDTNVQKAIELYNARKKAGGTGLEDWEDSRTKGAAGGWNKAYVNLVASETPHNNVPVPPKNKPHNQDPTLGNYNVVEQLAGHQELPFMMANAAMWDAIDKTDTHKKEVLDLWRPKAAGGKGNPAAASAIYGLNSPKVLDLYKRSGNPVLAAYGDFLSKHPNVAGLTTFAQEWFNPLSWAEGGAAGKLLGGVVRGMPKIPGIGPALDNLTRIVSSYGGIVAEHGEGARNHLAAVGQRMSAGESAAHQKMMDVFKGTTAEEQEEIVRRQQNLPKKDFGSRNDTLDQRAKMKRDITRDLTTDKLQTGALKKTQVFGSKNSAPTTLTKDGKKVGTFQYDPGTYHGMKDMYNHPNENFNNLLESMEVRGGIGGSSIKHKKFDNIDEAKADGEFGPSLLRGDIDHAEAFRNFLSTGYKRVEFEKGMRELSQAHPNVIKVPLDKTERQAMMDSGKYIPLQMTKYTGINTAADRTSGFMKQAMISRSFNDFLNNKNSMSRILGKSLADRGIYSDNPAIASAQKWTGALNTAWRTSIIANPGFHPFWNVATNASAAGSRGNPVVDMAATMANYTRALLGTGATVTSALGHAPVIGGLARPATRTLDSLRQTLEHTFLEKGQNWQDAVHEALHAGAGAEFGAPRTAMGGSAGRIFTRVGDGRFAPKFSDINETMDRWLTHAGQWNQEGTFGARGEQAFATTLFHRLVGKGGLHEGDPYGASWAVREALGNYKNIDPENWASKFILFFPWLASNVPFWFKTLTGHPQFVTAPTQASRTQRENAGDPTAYDAANPHFGISTYNPETGSHWDAPLPFKDMERFAQAGTDALSGDEQGAIKAVEEEFASRAKPLVGAGFDTALTTFDERANPVGSYVGYNTMYNKNEPDREAAQLGQSVGLEIAPLPAPFVTRNIIRNGFDPSQMGAYLAEAAGLGYVSTKTADNYRQVIRKAQNSLQAKKSKLDKIMTSAHPMSEDQQHAFMKPAEDAYEAKMKAIQGVIQKGKGQANGLPPGNPYANGVPLPAGNPYAVVGH